MKRFASGLAALFWISQGALAQPALRIEWELSHPFRLIKAPGASAENHYANKDAFSHSWKQLRDLYIYEDCIRQDNPVLCSENYVGPVRIKQSGMLLNNTSANDNSARYDALVRSVTRFDPKERRHPGLIEAPGLGTHQILVRLQERKDGRWVDVKGKCQWTVDDVETSGDCINASVQFRRTYGVVGAATSTVSVREIAPSIKRAMLSGAATAIDEVLIVGLGESFAAGEGAPDIPYKIEDKTSPGQWPEDDSSEKARAHWLDRQCHRSLLSSQNRAVMHMAAANPKKEWIFLGLACSGSQIVSGLLWAYEGVERTRATRAASGSFNTDISQINSLFRELCRDYNDAAILDDLKISNSRGNASWPKLQDLDKHIMHCTPERFKRKIDAFLLSVGGNDVGFSRVATHILTQSLKQQFPGDIKFNGESIALKPSDALGKIGMLEERYAKLHSVMAKHFAEAPLILSQYPNLLRGAPSLVRHKTGAPYPSCSTIETNSGTGLEYLLKALGIEQYPSRFDLLEPAVKGGESVLVALNRVVGQKRDGWHIANSHLRKFEAGERGQARGVCVNDCVRNHSDGQLSFHKKFGSSGCTIVDKKELEGSLAPHLIGRLDLFNAFASTRRYFRTPNDAKLVSNTRFADEDWKNCTSGHAKFTCGLLNDIETVYGSIHPNSYGHAAIADAYVRELKAVLANR